MRTLTGHENRVGSLAWNDDLLSACCLFNSLFMCSFYVYVCVCTHNTGGNTTPPRRLTTTPTPTPLPVPPPPKSNLPLNRPSLSFPSQKGSGGRDARILNYDLRMAQPRVRTLLGHTQEVCGLRWSPDGSTLASGVFC